MIENLRLSEHFGLYELTKTANAALQDKNRELTEEQVAKLRYLAVEHCERLRYICGGDALRVHSGYRSPALNEATAGSSSTSQHPRCEAVDFDVPGQEIEDSFNAILDAARQGLFSFGQLIIEQADRGYRDPAGQEVFSRWIHCSVIGTLNPDKVGQVLRMKAGPDGKQTYTLLDRLKFRFGAEAA